MIKPKLVSTPEPIRRTVGSVRLLAAMFVFGFVCACIAGPSADAPTGFDNQTNGLVENKTHQADQAKFDEVENVDDGLGPIYNAQSCRECHQNPTSGAASQVTELRVGHRGRDGKFRNPDIAINHGTEIIAGRSLVNDRAAGDDFGPVIDGDVRIAEFSVAPAMAHAQFGHLTGGAGGGILVALPARLSVVDRSQPVVHIFHFIKFGLIRLVGFIFDQAVGLVVKAGWGIRRWTGDARANKTENEHRGKEPHASYCSPYWFWG